MNTKIASILFFTLLASPLFAAGTQECVSQKPNLETRENIEQVKRDRENDAREVLCDEKTAEIIQRNKSIRDFHSAECVGCDEKITFPRGRGGSTEWILDTSFATFFPKSFPSQLNFKKENPRVIFNLVVGKEIDIEEAVEFAMRHRNFNTNVRVQMSAGAKMKAFLLKQLADVPELKKALLDDIFSQYLGDENLEKLHQDFSENLKKNDWSEPSLREREKLSLLIERQKAYKRVIGKIKSENPEN